MAMTPNNKEAFIAFLNGLIEEFAKAVFEESQRRVPERSQFGARGREPSHFIHAVAET